MGFNSCFKGLILWDSFYKLQCLASSSFTIYLWPEDSLVIEAETCCHLVTLNKMNIHNTSCVLTCESLLLISYWFYIFIGFLWGTFISTLQIPELCDKTGSLYSFLFSTSLVLAVSKILSIPHGIDSNMTPKSRLDHLTWGIRTNKNIRILREAAKKKSRHAFLNYHLLTLLFVTFLWIGIVNVLLHAVEF